MRKLYSMRAYLTLCILAVLTLIGGVNAQAQYYELVTDVNQLKDGDKCLIVNVANKKALGKESSNGNNRTAQNVTIENNQIQPQTIGIDVTELTLGITEDGKYTFHMGTGYLCAASSSSNYLKSQTTLNDNGKATITIGTNGSTTIKFTGNYTHNTLKYNTSSNIFSCYSSGQLDVVLFRYVTSSDPKPTISFSETTYSVNIGQPLQLTATALLDETAIEDGKITYSSSDTNVATIDESGNITAIGEGTSTITATLEAIEGSYQSATATCKLTVIDPNKVNTPMFFKKVTSTDELIEGGQYIIVCEDQNVAMTTISSNNKGETASIEITDEATNAAELPNNVTIYTVSNKDNDGYFNLKNGSNYLSAEASGTNMSISANAVDNTKWKLDATNGIVYKSNATQSTKRAILLNNSYLFGHYAVQNIGKNYYKAQLYRLEASATIKEGIGYTTFYTDKVYQMADGLTAYVIQKSDEANKVKAVAAEEYAAGKNVPAKTALLLGGTTSTYRLPVLNLSEENKPAAYTGENLLEGTRDNGFTASAKENVLYYKLTTLNGKDLGFYWGAANGAAFQMKNPTTAYLAVDKAVAGANGLRLVIGESGTTGIGSVTETTQNGAIYTISGVRVNAGSTAGLPKGIYIVNGKKLLVK